MDPIYPNAEALHPANDNPKWTDCYYFWFYDPKSTAGGCMRIGLHENLKKSEMYLILFKDGKLTYNRISAVSPYTPDRMVNGVEVAGLRFTSIKPLEKALVEYSVDGTSVSLIFDALQPMADAIAMTPEGQHTGMKDNLTAAHLEGPTWVNGTIVLRGTKTEIKNCIGFRDLSWGVRNWDGISRYMVSWPTFTNGQTIAVVSAKTVEGRESYMKMLHDGKEWLAVDKFEYDIKFCDDKMTIESANYRVWDSRNRVWEYTAKPFFRYFIPHDSFVSSQHWAEFRLSDGTVGYGLQEYGFRLPLE
jgi:hypothetical protein